MTRKMISTLGMIAILLISIVGTAGAQGEVGDETPTTTPTSEPTQPAFYTHPIVQLLSAYFGRMGSSTGPDETATPDPDATVDPSATPTEEPTTAPGPEEIAEQLLQYHDEGIGFGVLVKLYAIAEASAEECAVQPGPAGSEEPVCTPVTVDELVTAMQSGTSIGELFKEYGKPSLLGVGHVRKALNQFAEETPEPPVEETLEPPVDETQPAESVDKPGKEKQPKEKPPKDKPPKEKTPKPKDKGK